MAANNYGYSRAPDRGGTIANALIAYGQQGGALYAAYRLADNPLVLSHVRWQGENGAVIEAQHTTDGMHETPQEEREAWAEIALISTTNQADAVGPNAPWLPVWMDREHALELGLRAQRARLSSQAPQTPHGMSGVGSGYGSGSHSGTPFGGASPYSGPPPSQVPHAAPPFQPPHMPMPNPPSDEYSPTRLIDALPSSPPSMPDLSQNTGQWARDDLLRGGAYPGPSQQEITVIPCVEVEMPVLLSNDQQDFTRDFARDVAIHFGRAARGIPQTRELRGWMRGARIVLAARMGFGLGSRPANRAEMEHAAALLSEALARRTLPYAQLRFAEYPEWSQGVELPS